MKNRRKQWIIITLFILLVRLLGGVPIYGKDQLFSEIVSETGQYRVDFQEGIALVSRDGSEAVPIGVGTLLKKPGTYFISFYKEGRIQKIQKVILPRKETRQEVVLSDAAQLEEVLKGTFAYGSYNMKELSQFINQTIEKLVRQYPKLAYEGNRMRYETYANATLKVQKPVVEISFMYPLQIKNTLKQYDARANQKIIQIIEKCISPGMRDYEMEWALANYIIKHVTYSSTTQRGVSYVNPKPLSHTLYGTLLDQNAVCDGYARSTQYLMNAVGIPTKLVVGTTIGNIGHAWNLVKIQEAYYHLDTTWADEEEENSQHIYNYFNERDDFMKITHTWDVTQYPKAVAIAYSMPYIPLKFPNTYSIEDSKALSEMMQQFKKSGSTSGTLILKNVKTQKWYPEAILKQLVNQLGKGVTYTCYYKYDCFVISFDE